MAVRLRAGRRWRLLAAAVGAAAIGALALATPASAHVTVSPTEAVQGGFTRVAFRVPTESDTLSTTKLEIHLPENAPVGSVSTMPVPGWTVVVQRRTLDRPIEVHGAQLTEVVSVVSWTASPEAVIKPGQFQEFPVSFGPLPTVDRMVFKALQTYSDGTIVRWIDEPKDGAEAEHPAPVLRLVPAAARASGAAGNGAAGGGSGSGGGTGSGSGLAVGLAIAALVVGLGGLVLGGLAFLRGRQPAG